MRKSLVWWGAALVALQGTLAVSAAHAGGDSYYADVTDLRMQTPDNQDDALAPAPAGNNDILSSCCDDGCCGVDPYWYVGTEVTFLVPNLHGGNAFTQFANSTTGDLESFSSAAADPEQMGFGPRVWVGRQWDVWGVQMRFWYFNNGSDAADPLFSNQNDIFGYTALSSLRLYTIDLEATRILCSHRCWLLQATGGVRYASFDQAGSISSFAANGTDLFVNSASYGSQFNGTGLTFSLNGRRSLFSCRNISLFANARGSILWGTSQANATTGALAQGTASASTLNTIYASDDTADLFIGEVQLGVQWDHQLKCLPAAAFVRFALEYQYWDTANGAGVTSLSTSSLGAGSGLASANSGDQRLDLFGFTIGTGLTW